MGKAGTLYPAQIPDSKTLRPLIPAHEECRGACILTTHSFMKVAVQRQHLQSIYWNWAKRVSQNIACACLTPSQHTLDPTYGTGSEGTGTPP